MISTMLKLLKNSPKEKYIKNSPFNNKYNDF